jgi:mono/diheme cytochrome c family protein/plastocyanin
LDDVVMRRETLARLLVALLIVIAFAIPFGGRRLSLAGDIPAVNLVARMPENGGWSHDVLRVRVGEPLRLRLSSEDVVHGFAVGKTDHPAVNIYPGQVSETVLVFDQPGRYTYYCTRWCGPNHWRMRGTIEVTGEAPGPQPDIQPPLFVQLDLDIDDRPPAAVSPSRPPSAERGRALAGLLPEYAVDRDVYQTHSPADLWQRLRKEEALDHLSDANLWNLVAFVWQNQASPKMLQLGRQLYLDSCAACHDLNGSGEGVIVRDLPEMSHENMGSELVRPPDFSDPAVLLGASPAVLEGKIIRGGMGTGMPSYGPILTDTEIDAVVAYLYTFVLDHD